VHSSPPSLFSNNIPAGVPSGPKRYRLFTTVSSTNRLTMRCSERLRAVPACASDPSAFPSAGTGCASPPPSLSLGSLGRL
jgi:hypothetical protein